jgi:large subunit ribosomal protein L24
MPSVAKKKKDPVSISLRKNDQVKVIAGRDREKTGRVLRIDEETGRVLIEHVNMIKRHTRKNPQKRQTGGGGIVEREAPIAVSNVMILCSKCGPVRIKRHVEHVAGKTRRTRVCHKCGLALDKK